MSSNFELFHITCHECILSHVKIFILHAKNIFTSHVILLTNFHITCHNFCQILTLHVRIFNYTSNNFHFMSHISTQFFLMNELCIECKNNPSKYKCPKCRAGYCCVNCFKIHKTHCPGNVVETKTVEAEPVAEIPPFELFRSNKKIIDALGDPRLQKIIKRIDSAEDRESDLVKELNINPEFKEFVDNLLDSMPEQIEP